MKAVSSSEFRGRIVAAVPALQPGDARYPWLVLLATSVATFMATLDSTIVNVALNKLTVAFGVSTETTEWVITAYMLAFGVTLPVSGWMADRFGYKRIFLVGLALFTSSSFAASFSWSMGSLIFFRVIQAVGGGLVQPLGMAIISLESPQKNAGSLWASGASRSPRRYPWGRRSEVGSSTTTLGTRSSTSTCLSGSSACFQAR